MLEYEQSQRIVLAVHVSGSTVQSCTFVHTRIDLRLLQFTSEYCARFCFQTSHVHFKLPMIMIRIIKYSYVYSTYMCAI